MQIYNMTTSILYLHPLSKFKIYNITDLLFNEYSFFSTFNHDILYICSKNKYICTNIPTPPLSQSLSVSIAYKKLQCMLNVHTRKVACTKCSVL